jgi:predicted N-acetyltransferase YhbS
VAWDGGAHAFLLDPTVVPDRRRQGLGSALVRAAIAAASRAGAEWLHVDYVPALAPFYASVGFAPSHAGVLRLEGTVAPIDSTAVSGIEYRRGATALPVPDFIELTRSVWGRDLEPTRVASALARTLNVGAWHGGRLVGAVRVLTDGYLLNTIPEVMVDPVYQRQGIGRELMYQALSVAPGGRLFFGAQSGNEPFFERIGFVRGPTGFVGRLDAIRNVRAG